MINCKYCQTPFIKKTNNQIFCSKQCSWKYYESLPKTKKYRKIYEKYNRVTTTKGHFKVKKRMYNGNCELCGYKTEMVDWHHWNDEHLEWGLWLCKICHRHVEFYEHGKIDKYLQLKKLYGGEN